jgi:cell division septum initiation protein DivIVA
VLREARAEAERIVEQARTDARRLGEEVSSLERLRRAQLAQLRALAERQLAEIVAAEQTLPATGELGAFSPGAAAAEGHGTRPSYPTPAWLNRVDET